jgi:hypothetical protein
MDCEEEQVKNNRLDVRLEELAVVICDAEYEAETAIQDYYLKLATKVQTNGTMAAMSAHKAKIARNMAIKRDQKSFYDAFLIGLRTVGCANIDDIIQDHFQAPNTVDPILEMWARTKGRSVLLRAREYLDQAIKARSFTTTK